MKRYILSLIVLLVSAPGVFALEPIGKHSVSVDLGVSVPTGGSRFIDKAGFVPTLAYEFRFNRSFSIGLAVDYLHSTESGDMRVNYYGDIANGYAKKKLDLIPMRVQFRWYPLAARDCGLQPYVTIGAGVQHAKFSITGDQIISREHKNWSGVITPDVGVRWFPGNCRHFFLDGKVSWQWGGNAWKEVDHNKSQQALRIQIGAGVAF